MNKWAFAVLIIGAFAVLPAATNAQTEATVAQTGPQITMIVAHNAFRDEEFEIPFKHFSSVATVIVASSKLGELTGMLGLKARAELLVKDINVEKLDALVIVGGPGAREYWKNPTVHKLVRQVVAKNKVLAAICISPVTLAYAGVLKGKKATVWMSERNRLIAHGARYTGKDVEVDGLIVTGKGPQASEKFADAVIELVKKQFEKRREAREAEKKVQRPEP